MAYKIAKVRASLFQINGVKKEPLVLPEAEGMVTTLTEKVYVPVKEHPDNASGAIKIIIVHQTVVQHCRLGHLLG
ncbi:Held out wings [Operophtera brumata]|uniref:Held out wings n=1 Tax=Operophtera brumata TaxID=104452 RepID=A0A0L7LQU5_OPEBR|nr:Held out wings [Operophtera brumata]